MTRQFLAWAVSAKVLLLVWYKNREGVQYTVERVFIVSKALGSKMAPNFKTTKIAHAFSRQKRRKTK